MKASEYYKTKPLNSVNQKWNKDGTVEVTIHKHGWRKPYKFKARNLYEKNEQIVEDEEVC